jgi:plastocyanin
MRRSPIGRSRVRPPLRPLVLKRVLIVAAAVCALAIPVAVAAPDAAHHKTAHVTVADDYYSPTAVKIKKGSKVSYDWSDANVDSHNVKLTKGPKKIDKKDFKSATGAIGISFAPKFKVPGKYHFVCTLHRSVMQMDVTVKK